MSVRDEAPPVVVSEHNDYRRLMTTECVGDLHRDESGMWECLNAGCSFRTIVREQRGVRADQYVPGRHDTPEEAPTW